jgi:hypothetical protein
MSMFKNHRLVSPGSLRLMFTVLSLIVMALAGSAGSHWS